MAALPDRNPESPSGRLQLRPTDLIVAVMGVTGAGKSTFISSCTSDPSGPKIGHSVESETQTVEVFKCEYSPTVTIHLVDTPGFDDTERSDKVVLEIGRWLGETYKQGVKLNGVIYLHRITDNRMTGSARTNLTLFKKLCRNDALKRVILATTTWGNLPLEDEGIRREKELINKPEFWGFMCEKGSQVRRYANSKESAMEILDFFVQATAASRVALSIQRELVEQRQTLDQTAAGKELDSALTGVRERFKREMDEFRAELKEAQAARDQETAKIVRQERDDREKKIRELDQIRAELKVTLEELNAQKRQDTERMRTLEEQIQRMAILKDVVNQESVQDRPGVASLK